MLAYDWPDMDTWALVLLGESKTAEYRKIIDEADSPQDDDEDTI